MAGIDRQLRERPILFNGAMVRAMLAGQKTQTRRVVKPAPPAGHTWAGWCGYSTAPADEGKAVWAAGEGPLMIEPHRVACPFGQPGDRMWVRETWMDVTGTGIEHWDTATGKRMRFAYGAASPAGSASDEARKDFGLKWRPSIHMPREACRLVLEITAVRVERLQAISEADAKAEGIQPDPVRSINLFGCSNDERAEAHHRAAVRPFRELWTSTGGDWDSNPWVWVIEFKRVEMQP